MSKSKRTVKSEGYKTTGDGTVNAFGGRPAAIGGAGAMGGGDDFKQKIGRNKIPFSPHGLGSPSQVADAGFSSKLANSNKGRGYGEGSDDAELAALIAMFPEQEEEDDDMYNNDMDDHLPVTKKLSRRSMIKEFDIFDDDYIVENSRYSLVKALDENMATDLTGFVKDTALDLTGDAASNLVSAIPWAGKAFSFFAVFHNLKQLEDEIERGNELLIKLKTNGDDNTVSDLEKIFNGILIDLIDVLERAVAAIPVSAISSAGAEVVSVSGAALGVLSKVGTTIAKIASAAKATKGWKLFTHPGFKKLNFAALARKVTRLIANLFESDEIPKDNKEKLERRKFILIQAVEMMIDIQVEIENYEEQKYRDSSYKYVDSRNLPDYRKYLREDKMKTKKMTALELRSLISTIKESVYEDYTTYHEDKPTGYQSRDVPEVDEEGNVVPCDDVVSDDAVNYSVEDGIVSYQARDMSVQEAALRNLIRNEIIQINEDKKKE